MSKEIQNKLELGVGILRVLKGQKFHWATCLKELIDNSLGARAKSIIFHRSGDVLEIIDDGDGCDNLFVMESPAKSIKYSHNKAGMFGIGGVLAQIQISDGGIVEVLSSHKKAYGEISINWNKCIEDDKFEPMHETCSGPIPGLPTGTKIRILNAKKFYGLERVIKELGHNYAGELRRGKVQIVFDLDGKILPVEPFSPPPFIRRVDFDFDFKGHRVQGFTAIVKPGVSNTYKGWSVHWGYRFAFITYGPGGEHSLINRIYGEIHLPRSWENITPTKDEFTDDASDLWDMIAEKCSEVIKEATDQSTDLLLNEASEITGNLLTQAIVGSQNGINGIKGRRPGTTGKAGTKSPTGLGSEHANFTTWQPGDKPANGNGVSMPAHLPSRIRIAWDETLEYPFSIDVTGTRKTTMTITLNKSIDLVHEFKSDPNKLAVMCCGHIAQELASNARFGKLLPLFQGGDYRDSYAKLIACLNIS